LPAIAVYQGKRLPVEFFDLILEKSKNHPSFAISNSITGKTIGFCNLKPFQPFSNGYKECGRFVNVINKNSTSFDMIWMQKDIL